MLIKISHSFSSALQCITTQHKEYNLIHSVAINKILCIQITKHSTSIIQIVACEIMN